MDGSFNYNDFTPFDARTKYSGFFFVVLEKNYTHSRMRESVTNFRQAFIQQTMDMHDITRELGNMVVQESIQQSKAFMVYQADKNEENFIVDDDEDDDAEPPLCVVCNEKPATQHFVHGNTVHKCTCAKCCMKLLVSNKQQQHKCPVCQNAIERVLFVKFSKRECQCGGDASTCKRVLVVGPDGSFETNSCDLWREGRGRVGETVYKVFSS
jgi:hypothetical protein